MPFEITLSGVGVAVPEIDILQENGTQLTSGTSSADFGSAKTGTASGARTFTIRNLGSAPLTGLAVASQGPNAADFKLAAPVPTRLAPGASTTFQITFQPTTPGARTARIAISSNDADEKLFTIAVAGTGIAAPEIEVLKQSTPLNDDASFVNFGPSPNKAKGKTLTFKIRNSGTASLEGIALRETGIHRSDFKVSHLRIKSLAPGASATFKVTFKPSRTGSRWAAIRIGSNDPDEGTFDIILTGKGKTVSPSARKKATAKKSAKASGSAPPVVGTEVIDGRKYRTLTITHTAAHPVLPSDVEVSSNLLDWFSGRNHTTVLVNNAITLKVRDNTPVRPHGKRYIRLKSAAAK